MDEHHEFAAAIADLREDVPAVRRVIVASVDGLPVYDEIGDHEAARCSALGAAVLGLKQRAVSMVEGENFQEAVLQGTEGSLVVYAAGGRLVLVLVLDAAADLALTHRKACAMALRLAGPSDRRLTDVSQLAEAGQRAS